MHFVFKFIVFSLFISEKVLLCSFNAKNQEQTHIYNLYNELTQRINKFKSEHVMPVEMNLDILAG